MCIYIYICICIYIYIYIYGSFSFVLARAALTVRAIFGSPQIRKKMWLGPATSRWPGCGRCWLLWLAGFGFIGDRSANSQNFVAKTYESKSVTFIKGHLWPWRRWLWRRWLAQK